MTKRTLLRFNIEILKILNLWPNENETKKCFKRFLKDFCVVFYVIPVFISLTVGLYMDNIDENMNGSFIIENMIATTSCIGLLYVIICFVRNRNEIISLVKDLEEFKKYGMLLELFETDKKATIFTLSFLVYGIVGVLVYTSVPFFMYNKCQENRTTFMEYYGIPCGLVVTKYYVPFKFDYAPYKQIIIIYQITICLLFTTVISSVTLFLCAILMHTSNQLKCLSIMLQKLDKLNNFAALRLCFQYHGDIILFAKKINRAFKSMMFLHISVTSFIISILGYQILFAESYINSLSYSLHLAGWLVLFFCVCYNGQNLINGSTNISLSVYQIRWYASPPNYQRDILLMILRSQKPLILTAVDFSVMSFATYLQVLSNAYSYFTLLLKMKS